MAAGVLAARAEQDPSLLAFYLPAAGTSPGYRNPSHCRSFCIILGATDFPLTVAFPIHDNKNHQPQSTDVVSVDISVAVAEVVEAGFPQGRLWVILMKTTTAKKITTFSIRGDT